MAAARTRTRLSPEARRDQLLTTAKKMIVDEGLQHFTMESLAREAAVSSPLVYNYFDSRQSLLQELLEREYTDYTTKLTADVGAAKSFEEVVRLFIASNFDHYAPGNILPILQSQPEIAQSISEVRKAHGNQVADFLVRATAKTYKLTTAQAELLVSMSSGASIAAAEYCARRRRNRQKSIDAALAYVLAGLAQFATPET